MLVRQRLINIDTRLISIASKPIKVMVVVVVIVVVVVSVKKIRSKIFLIQKIDVQKNKGEKKMLFICC